MFYYVLSLCVDNLLRCYVSKMCIVWFLECSCCVVALGTGTKCLGITKMSKTGTYMTKVQVLFCLCLLLLTNLLKVFKTL